MAEQQQQQLQQAEQQQFSPDQLQSITVALQTLADIEVVEQDESESDSSSSDYDSDEDDPQAFLNKAGCNIQLSNLELTPEGTIPLEISVECLKCLLFDKLWAALILCKAITTLQPSNVIAAQLQPIILSRIQQKLEQEFEGSDSGESVGASETESDDSCESDSDTDSDSEEIENPVGSQNKVKEEDKHSCLACTN